MAVAVAPGSVPVMDRVGTPTAFTDPLAGLDFATTIPSNQRWRIHGASFLFVASAIGGNRAPAFWAGVGSSPVRVASTSVPITASQTRTVVFYDQEFYYNTQFLSIWAPVGLRAVWLPPAATVKLQVVGIQAGDQLSQVNLWLETDEV